MGTNKKYSVEFKQEVLSMVAAGERNVSQIEGELDITPGSVYKWQQRYRVMEEKLQPSAERAEQTEIRPLKRELEITRQERDILKKAIRVFSREGIVSRYQFIADHHREYPVQRLCAVLGVVASGFYDWLQRDVSQRQRVNEAFSVRIREIHEGSRQTYGYTRIHAELREAGEVVGKHWVARLMTHMGLKTFCQRRFRLTTQANDNSTPAPNVLAQDFSATRPNQKWLVDITYIATREGWLYLAGVLDTYSRRIVGWSMSERPTETLVCDALHMALTQRGAPDLHHSDRGSQYTSHAYLALLEKAQVQVSMSGVGCCFDNAMKESFWATLKRECADHVFQIRALARQAILSTLRVITSSAAAFCSRLSQPVCL
ncbi:MAG: IS3 family transposase [Anaerolineaceae bacterium]|nr:IS3 family transposase [Anaerolineaceae bacterium]